MITFPGETSTQDMINCVEKAGVSGSSQDQWWNCTRGMVALGVHTVPI